MGDADAEILFKYNSLGAGYWRDKLHKMYNGLTPEEEMPDKEKGSVQQDQ